MKVMVSNASGMMVGHLATLYPGSIAHLFTPGGQRGPWPFVPYALDNGAWPAWLRGRQFDEDAWYRLLDWTAANKQQPLWSLVPDFVADRDRTLEYWARFSGDVIARGFRPAFAVQDGMTFEDVPSDDCVLFLGGSTSWKVAAIDPWCARFPKRVHVARVNNKERLWKCYRAGAISVDGTGWFHSSRREGTSAPLQLDVLMDFLAQTAPIARAA